MNLCAVQPDLAGINAQLEDILVNYGLSGCFHKVAGSDIFSVDRGQGRPVVFIHGLSSSLFTWRFNLRPLSRFFRVIALDLPGFGFSPKPQSELLNRAGYVNFVRHFLEQKGITSAILVGHSFGGTICLELCRQFEGLVEALVLVSATDKGGNYISGKKIKNLLIYLYHDKSLLTPDLYKIFKFTSQRYLPNTLLRLIQSDRVSSENRLKVPCQIVWGQYDALLPPENAREVAAQFNTAELSILADCGHAPHEEKYEVFNDVVIRFLDQHSLAHKSV